MSTAPGTRFRASCTSCRTVAELGAEAFRLALGRTRERTFYSFTCPSCGTAVRKPAGSGSWRRSPARACAPCSCTSASRGHGAAPWPGAATGGQ
ncbi:hypothetical protein ACFQZC_07195 [Streptacidiphilus monticola]